MIADAKTKVYGDADPALTYQVSGLKNGDTAGAVLNGGSLSRVAGENVGVYGINQGASGEDAIGRASRVTRPVSVADNPGWPRWFAGWRRSLQAHSHLILVCGAG